MPKTKDPTTDLRAAIKRWCFDDEEVTQTYARPTRPAPRDVVTFEPGLRAARDVLLRHRALVRSAYVDLRSRGCSTEEANLVVDGFLASLDHVLDGFRSRECSGGDS